MKTNRTGPELDLLTSCEEIAMYLGWTERQVKHRVATGKLPTFRIGRTVCARRSTLAAHFTAQEAAASAGTPMPEPRFRNRQPDPTLSRPTSVIIGAAAIGERLGIDAAAVTQMDAARAIPTYIAGGLLCALASELDIYLAEGGR